MSSAVNFNEVNNLFKGLIDKLSDDIPPSRERAIAITNGETGYLWFKKLNSMRVCGMIDEETK